MGKFFDPRAKPAAALLSERVTAKAKGTWGAGVEKFDRFMQAVRGDWANVVACAPDSRANR